MADDGYGVAITVGSYDLVDGGNRPLAQEVGAFAPRHLNAERIVAPPGK
jgi:hypothetical protein